MNSQLSKDADALICLLYKQYVLKRKEGIAKSDAKKLGSSLDIQESILSKWSPEDVDDTCRELADNKLLDCLYADNIAYYCCLSDSGIIYMENRFKNGLDEILEYLSKIKHLCLF